MNTPAVPAPRVATANIPAGVFQGWWVLGAATVGMMLGFSNIAAISFGLFVVPLASESGLGRGDISAAYSVMTLAIVVFSPLLGSLVDRFGVRRILLPSIVLFALAIGCMSLWPGKLWQLYAMYFLVGTLGVGTIPTTYSRTVIAWFDRRRGLAIGIAMAGIGLGAAIVPPYVQWLILHFGWRGAYLGLAAPIVVVALPIVWRYLRESPHELGLLPDGADPSAGQASRSTAKQMSGYTFAAAIRTRPFWLMAVAFCLLGIFTAATMVHLIPLLQDRGVPAARAALAGSALALALVAGRIASGYLMDRFFAPLVVIAFLLAPLAGLALLISGASGSAAFWAAALLGLGIGAELDFMSYLVSRYTGMYAYGRVYGLMYAVLAGGTVIGALAMGYMQQSTGSYELGLMGLFVLTAIATVLFGLLGPYPKLPQTHG